jgi:hypothetical protein
METTPSNPPTIEWLVLYTIYFKVKLRPGDLIFLNTFHLTYLFNVVDRPGGIDYYCTFLFNTDITIDPVRQEEGDHIKASTKKGPRRVMERRMFCLRRSREGAWYRDELEKGVRALDLSSSTSPLIYHLRLISLAIHILIAPHILSHIVFDFKG